MRLLTVAAVFAISSPAISSEPDISSSLGGAMRKQKADMEKVAYHLFVNGWNCTEVLSVSFEGEDHYGSIAKVNCKGQVAALSYRLHISLHPGFNRIEPWPNQ
jgi:hypothetical protein